MKRRAPDVSAKPPQSGRPRRASCVRRVSVRICKGSRRGYKVTPVKSPSFCKFKCVVSPYRFCKLRSTHGRRLPQRGSGGKGTGSGGPAPTLTRNVPQPSFGSFWMAPKETRRRGGGQTVEKLSQPKNSEGKIIGKKTVRVVFPIKSNKFQNLFKSFEICISLSKRSKRTFLTS